MAVQVFRCRFLTRPPLLLCQRWAPSSRGLLVGSLPPAPGPFVCPPPASHGLTSASRQVSKSGGRCPPAPASPPTRRPPFRVLCLAAPTFGAVRCSPRRNLLGFRLASCGTWRRSCRGPPLRRPCAFLPPGSGQRLPLRLLSSL